MQSVKYRFDRFEVDATRRLLVCDGKEVMLTPRAFDLLVALVDRSGRLVTKNELLELVWPKLVVEENNLQVQISALRKVLGPRAIATVPGRGYKFTLLDGEQRSTPTSQAEAQDTPGLMRPAAPGNLPAQIAPLYGRAADMTRI